MKVVHHKKLFVLNCGSSSIKYKLFHFHAEDETVLAEGIVERIGDVVKDYSQGFRIIAERLAVEGVLTSFTQLDAAAHRVVHGGSRYEKAVIIDEDVIDAIRECIPLAPLHNPANLEGIMTLRRLAPQLPQVAVFDTAFHQSMPPEAYRYALPKELEEEGVRRYGFHGISHHYLTRRTAKLLGKNRDSLNMITIHLGNGASMAAIENGRSIDTTMGMTPLEGLVMGTRCGDLDPGVVLWLCESKGMDARDADALLNRRSGLRGLCGTNDMREIVSRQSAGDEDASFAFRLFCRRIRKYIGAYTALLGRVDAVVFSGGIGTNSPEVREEVCRGLAGFGIDIDSEKNRQKVDDAVLIQSDGSRVAVAAIRTDEELQIAQESLALLSCM